MNTEEIVALAQKCSEVAEHAVHLSAMNGVAQALLHAALRDQDPIGVRDALLAFKKPDKPE